MKRVRGAVRVALNTLPFTMTAISESCSLLAASGMSAGGSAEIDADAEDLVGSRAAAEGTTPLGVGHSNSSSATVAQMAAKMSSTRAERTRRVDDAGFVVIAEAPAHATSW